MDLGKTNSQICTLTEAGEISDRRIRTEQPGKSLLVAIEEWPMMRATGGTCAGHPFPTFACAYFPS